MTRLVLKPQEHFMKNIFKQSLSIGLWIWLFVFALTACAPAVPATFPLTAIPSATAVQQTASREAQIQSVELKTSQMDQLRVSAVVYGNLTESCATLGESQVQYAANTFHITVYANSLADIGCAQVTTPFETTIPLDTKDLPAGSYIVIANGVSAVFTLPEEIPTATAIPTAVMAPTNSVCTDSAAFIKDVTIPDNSELASNTAFTKSWRLKNTGTCTWDSSYLVAYISGAAMSQQPGYWIMSQGQTVSPGQTVDVSVGMTSPVETGSYASYWGLKKVDGPFMPVQGGANGDSFYVKIKVNNGITPGNVTVASIDIESEQGSGPACTADSTYLVHASITTNGATTVTYEIDSTAGQTPAGYFQMADGAEPLSIPGTFVFDQADTKTINLRFVGPYSYPNNITMLLWINGSDWYQAKLSCQ
jgi:hypothetical protein